MLAKLSLQHFWKKHFTKLSPMNIQGTEIEMVDLSINLNQNLIGPTTLRRARADSICYAD